MAVLCPVKVHLVYLVVTLPAWRTVFHVVVGIFENFPHNKAAPVDLRIQGEVFERLEKVVVHKIQQ